MAPRRLVRSSRVGRVAGPVLVVLALVAIVAVAATGSTSSGSGTSAPPADTLLDTIFSLLLLLSVAWVAIAVFSLARWREHELDRAAEAERHPGDRDAPRIRVRARALRSGARLAPTFDPRQTPLDRGEGGSGAARIRCGPRPRLPVPVRLAPGRRGPRARGNRGRRARAVEPQKAKPPSPNAELAAELALVLDETLDDLRAEADPRRAVIAAYARLERALATQGFSRDGRRRRRRSS